MREDTSSSFVGVRKNELCNLLDDSLVLIDLGCFSDFARLIPTLGRYINLVSYCFAFIGN